MQVSWQMANSRTTLSPTVLLCLAATWLIWGSTYLAIRFALQSFPPFFQMGSRFVIAGGVLLVWMHWRGARWPDRRQWRNAVIVGFLLLVSGMGATAYAEQSVPSGLIVTFVAVLPALISLLNLAAGIRPGRLEAAGIAIGFIGVVLLTRGAAFAASPVGLAAISLAVCSWSLGSVLSQRACPLAPGAMGFASEMLAGGLMLLVVSVVAGERLQWPLETLAVGSWLYLIVFGSLLAFNAYMYLLGHASSAVASSYAFVNPVIALLLGIWLGHESVTGSEWLAAGVILAGVVLLLRGR
jgi:drug/metabolite transporter (DMT)-like permease